MRTDNRILTYLNSKNKLKSRKLTNWALQLSEYDFEIVHVRSKNNEISDCLSRLYDKVNAVFELKPSVSWEEIFESQKPYPD